MERGELDVTIRISKQAVRLVGAVMALGICWLIVILSPSPGSCADSVDDELRIALELYRAGRLGQAERILRAVTAAHPDLAEAQNQLGAVLLAGNRATEALLPLQRACELAPEEFSPHFNLGAARLLARDFSGARSAFEAALKIKPRDLEAKARLAQALLAQEHYAQALPLLRDLRTRLPDAAEIGFYLAVCLIETGELARVGAVVEELRSQGMEDSRIVSLEARIKTSLRRQRQRHRGDLREPEGENQAVLTLKELGKRIERAPASAEDRFELGLRLEMERNFVGALRAFQSAADLGLHTASLSLATARSLVRQSQWEEAAALLETAWMEWPQDRRIPGPWASICNQMGAFDRTKQLLGKMDRARMSARELLELGVALAELGDASEAEELLRASLERDPALPKAHYRLGRLLMERGDRKEGTRELRIYQEILRPEKERKRAVMKARLDNYVRSRRTAAVVAEARELLAQGHVQKAVSLLRGAMEEFSGQAILHANLGAALARLDRHEEAIEELLAAVTADPERPDYHWALAAEYTLVGDAIRAEEHRLQAGLLEAKATQDGR